jgi:hypothetical protein
LLRLNTTSNRHVILEKPAYDQRACVPSLCHLPGTIFSFSRNAILELITRLI